MATILIIEWDGDKPPTTWYSRLRSHGISVRGKSDANGRIYIPEERREFSGESRFWTRGIGYQTDEVKGTIVQEGCVITASESFAHYLGALAKQFGAKSVHIGETQLEKYTTSVADAKTVSRIEELLGSRGRPRNGETFDYTITCIECGAVNTLKDVKGVIGCPSCRSVRVKYRFGEQIPVNIPQNTSLFNQWLSHRFLFRTFEPVRIDANGMEAPVISASDVSDPSEREVVNRIAKSPILSILDKMNVDISLPFSMLDSMFVSRAFRTVEERTDLRSEIAFRLFKRGLKPDLIDMIESDIPDIIDAVSARSDGDGMAYIMMTSPL